jgi:hypothetical protein
MYSFIACRIKVGVKNHTLACLPGGNSLVVFWKVKRVASGRRGRWTPKTGQCAKL